MNVYHMQFDVWFWTFCRDAKKQVISTYVAAEAPRVTGLCSAGNGSCQSLVKRGLKGPGGEFRLVQGMQPGLVGRDLEVRWAKERADFSNVGMTASEVVGLK